MTAPRCAACKRRLSDPASIAAGLGSHCRRKLAPAAPTPGRSDAARAWPGDGQLPLPEPTTPHHPPVWRGHRVQTVTTGDLL